MRKKSKKYNYNKFRLFFINTKKKIINYRLKLPKSGKVYSIFYLLLLKLADSKISIKNKFYYQV